MKILKGMKKGSKGTTVEEWSSGEVEKWRSGGVGEGSR